MLSLLVSDRTLVEKALEGDNDAVEALVLRYQNKAEAIARAILLGSAVDAEDVVQESFYQALRDLRSLRQPDRFAAWFVTIVRNVARGRLGERRPVSNHSLPEVAVNAPDEVEFQELRSRLWRGVAALPEGVREVIFLFYHDGESVRRVARTLGITRAATRKRLQKGRDLLRKALFRKLRSYLRETSSTPLERQRRARRSAILVCALPSFSGKAPAAATPVVGGALGGWLLAGGAFITKKVVVISAIGFVAAAALVGGLASRRGTDTEAPPAGGPELTAALSTDRRSIEEREQRHRGRAASAGELRAPLRPLRPYVEVETASGGEVLTLDFSTYTDLFARSLPLLGSEQSGDLSAGERARLSELRTELLRLAAQARSVAEQPLFEERLFGALLTALFRDGLDLSDEQVMGLEEAGREFFAKVPANPEDLDPLERFRLKEEMAHHVWDAMDGLLEAKQAASWSAVRQYSEQFFNEGYIHRVGIRDARRQIVSTFERLFGLNEAQRRVVESWAAEYEAAARGVLERYATSDDELARLPPRTRRALHVKLLELQRGYHGRVLPLLDAGQLSRFRSAPPHVLRFNFGRNSLTVFHGKGVF